MPLANFKDGYLPIDGGQNIYWSSHGNPDGKPLLLIHGGSGHIFDLEKLTAFPQDEYHIITWHQRGFGNSSDFDPDKSAHGIFAHVYDMEQLRRHLDIETWDVFSWSFGAIFMSAYAATYPEHVNSLTSYAPFLGAEEDWDVFLEQNPEKARAFLQHYNATSFSEAKKESASLARDKNPNIQLKEQFDLARLFGYEGSLQEFESSAPPEDWNTKLRQVRLAEDLYDEAMNKLPGRWLLDLGTGNHEFQSIPTSLYFGENDQWAAPNTHIWFVYPYSQQITLDGCTHDIYDPLVQAALAIEFAATPEQSHSFET